MGYSIFSKQCSIQAYLKLTWEPDLNLKGKEKLLYTYASIGFKYKDNNIVVCWCLYPS